MEIESSSGQMAAIQGGSGGAISTVHQDPVTKSQRITNSSGALTSTVVDLDPWGGETGRSSNQAFQPHRFTSYERDANGGDDAMMRRYQSATSRFSQPDPYDGSYSLTNPQSLNRYTYTQNDPVNFVDPSGLLIANDYGSCRMVPVIINLDLPNQQSFQIYVCSTYSGGGGGGGFGSGFRGLPTRETEQPESKKCNDAETLNEIATDVIGGSQKNGNVEGYGNATYGQISGRLRSAGFSRFYTNINPEHWFGDDFQGFVNGNWYHVTVGRPSTGVVNRGVGEAIWNPNGQPPFIQLHCEPNRPNSIKHLRDDYLLPRIWRFVPIPPRSIL